MALREGVGKLSGFPDFDKVKFNLDVFVRALESRIFPREPFLLRVVNIT